jgi:hypothetical protein
MPPSGFVHAPTQMTIALIAAIHESQRAAQNRLSGNASSASVRSFSRLEANLSLD